MNRINLFRNMPVKTEAFRSTPATLDSVTWGKTNFDKTSFNQISFDKISSTLVFAALLIVCSVGAGCSSDKPQPASSTNQVAMTQPMPPIATPAAHCPPAACDVLHRKVPSEAPVHTP